MAHIREFLSNYIPQIYNFKPESFMDWIKFSINTYIYVFLLILISLIIVVIQCIRIHTYNKIINSNFYSKINISDRSKKTIFTMLSLSIYCSVSLILLLIIYSMTGRYILLLILSILVAIEVVSKNKISNLGNKL